MSYVLQHTVFWFCWWDLPALIILIAVIVGFAVKRHNMKKDEKELEDLLSELYADDAVEIENPAPQLVK